MHIDVRFAQRSVAAALLAIAIVGLTSSVALAHGGREVGEYNFTVGFFVEPAFEGEKNGVDLRVVAGHDPVEGLEETLAVEVTVGDATLPLALRAVRNEPGRYTADFFPTTTGAYTFRFIGKVGNLDVDESFTSEVDNFASVTPPTDLQFPIRVASSRELQAGITGATDTAAEAQDAVSAAETRASIALAVGALGVIVGAGGLAMGMRRRA